MSHRRGPECAAAVRVVSLWSQWTLPSAWLRAAVGASFTGPGCLGEALVVGALLVPHPEHPDEPAADQASWVGGLVQQHQLVQRVAVAMRTSTPPIRSRPVRVINSIVPAVLASGGQTPGEPPIDPARGTKVMARRTG